MPRADFDPEDEDREILRAYLAGQALNGLLVNPFVLTGHEDADVCKMATGSDYVVDRAIELADKMISKLKG